MLYSTLKSSPSDSSTAFDSSSVTHRRLIIGALSFLCLAGVSTASADGKGDGDGRDPSTPEWTGEGGGPVSPNLPVGGHLIMGLSQAQPQTVYQAILVDEAGDKISQVDMPTDSTGRADDTMIWERSGVVGCDQWGQPAEVGDYVFTDFPQAQAVLSGRTFELRLYSDTEGLVATRPVNMTATSDPQFYFSDGAGCLRKHLEEGEALYLAAHNLPPDGSPYIFFLVERGTAQVGAKLKDVRPMYREQRHIIHRAPGETQFVELVWSGEEAQGGAFTGVIRHGTNPTIIMQSTDQVMGNDGMRSVDGITISPWDCVDCDDEDP